MPIEIHLNQKSAIFRPGDCVTGHVTVVSQNSSKTDGIELEWKGKVELMNKSFEQVTFLVFRTAQILKHSTDEDSEDSDSDVRIPFKHRLPSPIPPSHTGVGLYAQIRYSVQATLKRKWEDGVITLSTEKTFHVVTVMELLKVHMGNIKINHKVRAMMCCCCIYPTIEVGIALNKRGYYPGEDMAIQMAVINNSGSEIMGINFKLVQLVSISCESGYSYQRLVVNELNLHQIIIPSSRDPYTMPMKKLGVPATTPTYDNGDIMSIKYEVQCIICLPSVYDDIFLTLPVAIGTYPEALTSLMRKMAILPRKGTALQPMPRADLDSPEFASSIEEVRQFPSIDNLHSTQEESSDDSDSDGDQLNDMSNGIVNPSYQSMANLDSIVNDSNATVKQPKTVIYEMRKPNEWIVNYKRCGASLNLATTERSNRLDSDDS